MRFDAELAWGSVDPRPIVMYLPEQDDYMVVWNGVILPLVHAQCMAFEWIGVWAGAAIYRELDLRYRELYLAGAFGSRNWDGIIAENASTYHLLKRILFDHLEKTMPNYTRQEIAEWFILSNARTVESENVKC